MADDQLYITPHEAALAVVATSMKKTRLRLDTLIINSILGGIFFSAGGMLHLCAQAQNPELWEKNPGVVHFMTGAVYPIGLFYVIIMGAELYNSNILYFSVGVCRGAVSLLDLIISWSFSWLFNLAGNLFVCYVICHLSAITREDLYVQGSIQIANQKLEASFMDTFIRGIAGNFCVCLAVYLQLLCKPLHVKLIVMALPIFTFVSMGFTHTVADMYLVPMGLINGAPHSVGKYIWKTLLPATIGNAIGGSAFGIVVPWYLHLVVVERDRKMLNLPQYDAKDEQPELEMDSRVVRVPTEPEGYMDDSDGTNNDSAQYNPVSYNPTDNLNRTTSRLSQSSRGSRVLSKMRSPPGVFPVKGMGRPLTREASIAGENITDEKSEYMGDNGSLMSGIDSMQDAPSLRSKRGSAGSRRAIQRAEEEEYERSGGYNARENSLSNSLKRVVTHGGQNPQSDDVELGLRRTKTQQSRRSLTSERRNSLGLLRTLSRTFTTKGAGNAQEVSDHMDKYKITPKAANHSDTIAGIDNYDGEDLVSRPPAVRKMNSGGISRRSTVINEDSENTDGSSNEKSQES